MRKILFILFFALFAYSLDDIPSEFNATKEAQLAELNASLAFIGAVFGAAKNKPAVE